MKKLSLLFISIFFMAPIFSAEFNFSAAFHTGILYGKLGEYLYSSFSNYLLSYLEWDEKPLFMEGVTFSGNYKSNKIDLSFDAALPVKCGHMTDSDWKSYGIKTNYSIFDLYPVFACNGQIRYAYSFYWKDFTFGPAASLDLGYRSLKGKNGYGWNGGSQSWDTEGLPKKRYSGIDYQQFNTAINLEAQGTYKIGNFNINLLLGIAPFTYAKVTDYHSDENKYEDPSKAQDFTTISTHMALFKHFSSELGLEYNLNKNISLCTNLKALVIPNIKGPTWSDTYKKGKFEELYQASGMDLYELSWNLGVKIKN